MYLNILFFSQLWQDGGQLAQQHRDWTTVKHKSSDVHVRDYKVLLNSPSQARRAGLRTHWAGWRPPLCTSSRSCCMWWGSPACPPPAPGSPSTACCGRLRTASCSVSSSRWPRPTLSAGRFWLQVKNVVPELHSGGATFLFWFLPPPSLFGFTASLALEANKLLALRDVFKAAATTKWKPGEVYRITQPVRVHMCSCRNCGGCVHGRALIQSQHGTFFGCAVRRARRDKRVRPALSRNVVRLHAHIYKQ